jgi:hypothetical protein
MKQIDKINRDDQDKETILSIFYEELNIDTQTLLDAKLLELHSSLEPILTLNKPWLLDTTTVSLEIDGLSMYNTSVQEYG